MTSPKKLASITRWTKANPRRRKAIWIKSRYGITLDRYEEIMAAACGLCGGESKHLDHDHKTGKLRGPLCHHCNAGLGMFKDNPALLRKAALYVEDHRGY